MEKTILFQSWRHGVNWLVPIQHRVRERGVRSEHHGSTGDEAQRWAFLVHYDNLLRNSTLILPKTKKGGGAQFLLARKIITFTAFHRKIPRGKFVMERNTTVQSLSYSPWTHFGDVLQGYFWLMGITTPAAAKLPPTSMPSTSPSWMLLTCGCPNLRIALKVSSSFYNHQSSWWYVWSEAVLANQ